MKKLILFFALFFNSVFPSFSGEMFENLAGQQGITSKGVWQDLKGIFAKEAVKQSIKTVKSPFEYAADVFALIKRHTKTVSFVAGGIFAVQGIYFIYRLVNYIKMNKLLQQQVLQQKVKLVELLKKYWSLKVKFRKENQPSSSSAPQEKILIIDQNKKNNIKILKKDIKNTKKQLEKAHEKFIKLREQLQKQKSFLKKVGSSLMSMLRAGVLFSVIYYVYRAGDTIDWVIAELLKMSK